MINYYNVLKMFKNMLIILTCNFDENYIFVVTNNEEQLWILYLQNLLIWLIL